MSLARKTSRTLRLAGVTYRWAVSASRQTSTGEVTLVVERVARPGPRLAVRLLCRNYGHDFPHLDRFHHRTPVGADAYRPVTPARVARVIADALASGVL